MKSIFVRRLSYPNESTPYLGVAGRPIVDVRGSLLHVDNATIHWGVRVRSRGGDRLVLKVLTVFRFPHRPHLAARLFTESLRKYE